MLRRGWRPVSRPSRPSLSSFGSRCQSASTSGPCRSQRWALDGGGARCLGRRVRSREREHHPVLTNPARSPPARSPAGPRCARGPGLPIHLDLRPRGHAVRCERHWVAKSMRPAAVHPFLVQTAHSHHHWTGVRLPSAAAGAAQAQRERHRRHRDLLHCRFFALLADPLE